MAHELHIPIVGIDMVPRETSTGHTIAFLVVDLDARTVAIVQEVPTIAILFSRRSITSFGSTLPGSIIK